ncbi:hypothetical protein D9M68_968600 [compost metagenome]
MPAAAGVLRQCAGQPGLADARWTTDQDRVSGCDPVGQRETGDLFAINASARTGVEILNGGVGVFESGSLQQPGKLAVVAPEQFAIDQQRQAFLEGERAGARLGKLFLQGGGKAVKLE